MNDQSPELEEEVAAETPAQENPYRWEHLERQQRKWGEVTRQGLIVGRGARRKIVPPDEVYQLGALGCSDREIAIWFGIDEQTLRYNFKDYLAKAREDIKMRLRKAMFKNAIEHNSPALQIFLAKNMLGMSDSPTLTDSDKILPWSD